MAAPNVVYISQDQLERLINAISQASGSSGNQIGRTMYHSRSSLSIERKEEERALQRAAQSIDSVRNRLFGLSKDLDILKGIGSSLEKITYSKTVDISKHSELVAGMIAEFENTITDIHNVSIKLPKAIEKTAQETLTGNELFLNYLQKRLPKTADEFLEVFQKLQKNSQGITTTLHKMFSDFEKIETNIAIAQSENRRKDIQKYTEEYKRRLNQIQHLLGKVGIAANISAERINEMSLAELRETTKQLEKQGKLTEVSEKLNEQLFNFAKKVGISVAALNQVDKRASTLFKKEQFDKIFSKMGTSPQEVEFLKTKGLTNLDIFLRSLPTAIIAGVVQGVKLIIPQIVGTTKTAFERGTAPQFDAALRLRVGAEDLQTILADYKQTVLSGKGINETLKVLGDEKTREKFLQIAGYDPKLAAALNLRTQQFIKTYTQGTGDLQQGTQQWASHLRSMSIMTGKTADELLGMFEAQMETTEMQEVILRLSGKEQQIMIRNIQARQKEFTSLGLSAEKATSLAFALEKARQEAVPDRMKQAGRLAQLAMRVGMSQQEAMRLRHLYATGQTGTEEFIQLGKRLGGLLQQQKQQAQAFTTAGIFAPEHLLNRLVDNLSGVAREIVTGFTELKEREGMRIEEREIKLETAAFDNSVVKLGRSFISFDRTVDSLIKNLPGVLQNPTEALKILTGSALDLGKGILEFASKHPIESLTIAVVGLTAAVAGLKMALGLLKFGGKILLGTMGAAGAIGSAGGKLFEKLFKTQKGELPVPETFAETEPKKKTPLPKEKTPSKEKLSPKEMDVEQEKLDKKGKLGPVAKAIGRRLPFIGTVFAAEVIMEALKQGDWLGTAFGIGSAAASMVPGVGTAASIALDAANEARKTQQALKEGEVVSPTLPRHEAAITTMDKILTTQNEQLKQMVLLNKNTQTLINLLTIGNKHAELTSTSVRDLTNAYYSVEQQRISQDALVRAQTMRQYMIVPSVNPYIKTQ